MSLINETGNKHGRLTVLQRTTNKKCGNARWLCRCSCGKETMALGSDLRSGGKRSCGCLQKECAAKIARGRALDLSGEQYGRLTALHRSEEMGRASWACICECGNETVVTTIRLRSGNTRSCGCLRSDSIRLPKGEAAFNMLLCKMKGSARRREIEWALTAEQVRTIVTQHCLYCGVEPAQVMTQEGTNGAFVYNGIDRLDSSKGYVEGNVAPCCGACNLAKRSRTVDEFRAWVRKVYEHFVRGGLP